MDLMLTTHNIHPTSYLVSVPCTCRVHVGGQVALLEAASAAQVEHVHIYSQLQRIILR